MHPSVYVGPYIEIEAARDLNPYDIVGDRLFQPLREADHKATKKILTPNVQNKYSLNFGHGAENWGAVPILSEDIEVALDAFKDDYREEIAKLCGEVESLAVKWGAVFYYY